MATNKVFKIVRSATKKTIQNASSEWAEITTSKSGNNITVTATFSTTKTGKVAFYSKVPAENDSTSAPATLTGWTFLGSSDISGLSTTFLLTLAEFSAICFCARMVLQDNGTIDNGTADFSS
jgi:hypothetical protein